MDDTSWEEFKAESAAAMAPAAEPVADGETPEDVAAPDEVVDETQIDDDAEATDPELEDEVVETETFDWRQHPEAQAALAQAEQDRAEADELRQIKARLAEATRIQSEQAFQKGINDLADGDTERMQQVTGLIAQATAPLQQRVQALQAEATNTGKAASALVVAMNAVLDPDTLALVQGEYQSLIELDDPYAMERVAGGKRELIQRHHQELSAKDAEIAKLRKQLGAREAVAQRAGADLVDAGGGGTPDMPTDPRERLAQTETIDDYLDVMFGRVA